MGTQPPTTDKPSFSPTDTPTEKPTAHPTQSPTLLPTAQPTKDPTNDPTASPTLDPTHMPPHVIPHMCPHRSLPWHRHRRPARTCSSLMSCLQSTARPPSLPHSGLNFSTSSIRSSVTFPSHHMA